MAAQIDCEKLTNKISLLILVQSMHLMPAFNVLLFYNVIGRSQYMHPKYFCNINFFGIFKYAVYNSFSFYISNVHFDSSCKVIFYIFMYY